MQASNNLVCSTFSEATLTCGLRELEIEPQISRQSFETKCFDLCQQLHSSDAVRKRAGWRNQVKGYCEPLCFLPLEIWLLVC